MQYYIMACNENRRAYCLGCRVNTGPMLSELAFRPIGIGLAPILGAQVPSEMCQWC